MTMTNEEIVRHWQQAKKRDTAELRLLAELNAVSVTDIRDILESAGVTLSRRGPKGGDGIRFQELYDQGMNDAEIAAQTGRHQQTVANWRKKAGLPRHVSAAAETAGQEILVPPEIYGQLEALLAALPEDASPAVRRQAGEMLHTLFGEYLIERLELREEDSHD